MSDDDVFVWAPSGVSVAWRSSFGVTVPTPPDLGIIHTHTPPRIDDDATVKAEPFSIAELPPDLGYIKVHYNQRPEDPRAEPPTTTYYDLARLGSSVGDALRAYNAIVVNVRAGLRDAGLTDEATIERLTEAVVKRLGEGV